MKRLEKKRKTVACLSAAALLLLMGFAGYQYVGGGDAHESEEEILFDGAAGGAKAQDQAANRSAEKEAKAPEKAKAAFDLRAACPFALHSLTVASAAGAPSAPAAVPAAPLPAIPHGSPAPAPPLARIPSLPVPQGVLPVPSGSPVIQGVFTGEDGTTNIAILSDGKIVAEGEELSGKRIRVIDGNGIQFENGGSISYGK